MNINKYKCENIIRKSNQLTTNKKSQYIKLLYIEESFLKLKYKGRI